MEDVRRSWGTCFVDRCSIVPSAGSPHQRVGQTAAFKHALLMGLAAAAAQFDNLP